MIFQIDADEMIQDTLIKLLPEIFENNTGVDMYSIPRINTVSGLTNSHIQMWGWSVDSNGYINFPDYQTRIYKNDGSVKWVNKVHEKLEGYNMFSILPATEGFCLIHEKTIERQEK